ncbi:hypothetical protein ILYODFUR_038387 [Ilyodon furcidens]|uniref:Uncharacterized protein n=1 Tax=Ilyodon furcidens TaxID=33524 RepID=A0ABV0V2F7_9TELE
MTLLICRFSSIRFYLFVASLKHFLFSLQSLLWLILTQFPSLPFYPIINETNPQFQYIFDSYMQAACYIFICEHSVNTIQNQFWQSILAGILGSSPQQPPTCKFLKGETFIKMACRDQSVGSKGVEGGR